MIRPLKAKRVHSVYILASYLTENKMFFHLNDQLFKNNRLSCNNDTEHVRTMCGHNGETSMLNVLFHVANPAFYIVKKYD